MLERVLCLVVVFPDEVCESPMLARLRVCRLLYVVDVINVVLPRAGRRAPFLLGLYALDTRRGGCRLGFEAGV
jgi:hypothetical protein